MWKTSWKLAAAFVLVSVFAVIDEVRHFYHPYRTGLWQDIVLDITGGLYGILSYYFLEKTEKKKNKATWTL
ncbi:VanZ family protein [Alteribacillus sp. JSM 102045]|uniref:VanZ family protein n=1 Tax=Alteribacillus sp. JSM 102045 TaxID=1562101 RepID=UPI0035C00D92